jgi:polyisoprenyl-teichoic acid--peptidoglycan teichoic acid transferase
MPENKWTHEQWTVPNAVQPTVPREPIAQPHYPPPSPPPYYGENDVPPLPMSDRESAARERLRKRKTRQHHQRTEWAWVIVAVAMLSVVIVVSMSLSLLVRAAQESEPIVSSPVAAAVLPTPVDARTDFSNLGVITGDSDVVTMDNGRTIALQAWDGQSRFTVLAMGLDRRPGETGLSYRTDTMMLISIDPNTNQIGVLSIPRDLYVEVPGYRSLQRVNSAMVLGELEQPGYGPTLAMQTVQYNLGIRVHEFVAVDFNAVISIIDTIGGIEVDVPYAIADYQMPDLYYGIDPLVLQPGLQYMNGYTALRYARTRHGDSDFARAQRQQQVIFAVRDRVTNLGMMPQLIINSPSILTHLSENIYTGLDLDQMIQLALYAKDIPQDNITTGVIDGRYIQPFMTAEGASVLIPNRSLLGELMISVFGENYSE